MSGDNSNLSDADKIRLKRLARLGTPAPSAASQDPAPSGSAPSGSVPPQQARQPEQKTPVSSKPATPQPQPQPQPHQQQRINIKPASSSPQPGPSSSHSPAPPPTPPAETFEQWEETAVGHAFSVTLDRSKAEASNWSIVWLKGLLQELQEENAPAKLTLDIADRLLISRLSLNGPEAQETDDPEKLTVIAAMPSNQTALDFLIKTWQRVLEVRLQVLSRRNLSPEEKDRRLAAVEKLRDLVISYAGLNMQDPSMFPQPQGRVAGAQELLPTILSASSPSATTHALLSPAQLASFLGDLGRRFDVDEDDLPSMVEPIIRSIPRDVLIRHYTMSDTQFRPMLQALLGVSEVKPIAACFPRMDNWCPSTHTALFETEALLGPLIRLGCFPDRFPNVAKAWFPDPSAMGNNNIATTISTLQLSIKTHQQGLYALFNNIIRSQPDARERVLDFFAKALQMNVKRQGIQVDPRTVSGDGFMVNLQAILLQLSSPFIDAQYTKLDKVDIDYFRKSGRFDMSDETRVHADAQAVKQFESQAPTDAAKPNFISEIFFMTAWAHHLGYMPVVNTVNKYSRSVQDLDDQIKEIENDASWRGSPGEGQMNSQLEQMKKAKNAREGQLFALQTHLLDPNFVAWQSSYINFLMTWLVRQVDPKGQHPRVPIELPLPETTVEAFNMLPEWLFEDAIGFFNFLSRANPDLLASQSLNDLLTFVVVFLSTPYLRNPYIKGKFVEILYYNTRRSRDSIAGALGDAINTNQLALKSLMPALMRIYCDIEMTGQHTQFYDKFNIRYYIAMIFRVIWTNPTHREALHKEAARVDRFVRFVNLLINDTTYLLDESLSTLTKINQITKLRDNQAAWNALDEEQKKDKLSDLRQSERMAKMDINLCNETVRLLKILTAETQVPFVRPEIVDRLCSMLTFNLAVLSGPESQDLKVANPEDYRWQPKTLLSDLLSIFINLSNQEDFQAGLAREGRSYKPERFERAEKIARRVALKAEDELAQLRVLVERVEAIKADEAAAEELGEAPDEFLDPLTYTLMKDPVILPRAKQSIDRGSIVQHLLSDPRCPFTSTPLTLEECVPDVELKAQIDKFVAERVQQVRDRKATAASTSMEVDT